MLNKIIHFFVLFAYLNISVYEADIVKNNTNGYLFDGDSLVEFVLDDILDLVDDNAIHNIEVLNEEYRPFKNFNTYNILPIILILFTFSFLNLLISRKKVVHPLYRNKSICLPAYYWHLFRYKPF